MHPADLTGGVISPWCIRGASERVAPPERPGEPPIGGV